MVYIFQLIIGLVFILLTAMLFCNALEHLGERLGLSEGVTGAIFIAVGTALPEAIIPLLALFFAPSGQAEASTEVGIGAIMGPPLMLSTLSVALMAFAVWSKRGFNGIIAPEARGLRRDLQFFSCGYFLAIGLAISHNFYKNHGLDLAVVLILLLSYFFYVLLTIRASVALVADGYGTTAEEELYLQRFLRLPANHLSILIQAMLGFIGLIYFAQIFIQGITGGAHLLHLPVFLLALVLIPLATELPEKINSILWVRRGKDTLAMSNITGAMVFQGLLLPSMGILMTEWQLSIEKSVSCITTFIAVGWLYYHSSSHNPYRIKHFVINAALYGFSLILSLVI
jgi:cation:H+ antiporter